MDGRDYSDGETVMAVAAEVDKRQQQPYHRVLDGAVEEEEDTGRIRQQRFELPTVAVSLHAGNGDCTRKKSRDSPPTTLKWWLSWKRDDDDVAELNLLVAWRDGAVGERRVASWWHDSAEAREWGRRVTACRHVRERGSGGAGFIEEEGDGELGEEGSPGVAKMDNAHQGEIDGGEERISGELEENFLVKQNDKLEGEPETASPCGGQAPA
ncbi:hypothetical protein E2562_035651 [Oryza meyeriana var. granulata]|uniref:DUF834 domain-containing protein n=1 Tax=Oryza meyeriana var. granulata TaxID=110450 RepID=A0A6G1FFV8_9ORYZ|nr:hypothetical protein E2562_035651 [Oryza meyeriana var. granulata]